MNFFAIAFVFLCDQISKNWARKNLCFNESKTAIPDKIYFVKTKNHGFSNNVMSKNPEFVKKLSVIAIAFCVLYALFGLKSAPKAIKLGFSLILGGGIANLSDRFRDGYVTDFIAFKEGKAPVFNVADFFIFIGSGMFLIRSLGNMNTERVENSKN